MRQFRNILVGIDLMNVDSDDDTVKLRRPSRRALARAIWLASHTHAKLTISSVLPLPVFMEGLLREQLTEAPEEITGKTAEILERLVAQAKTEGVDAQPACAVGIPWEEICRRVQLHNHDLVIVGTRDLGYAGRIFFGSTAMKLLRYCPCPVWVARPDLYWEHQEILVPSDLSDVSLEALRVALDVQGLVDSRVHVLHVLEGHVGPPDWYGKVSPSIFEDYLAEQRTQAKKRLHEQLARVAGPTHQIGVEIHVVEGSADEEILKAIDKLKIDMVVMGTAARTGLQRMMLGNTAERLISHLRCSLIAVKPPGFCCPIAVESDDELMRTSPATENQPVSGATT
jgi:universal stress protein E